MLSPRMETERLILRRYEESDIDAMFEIITDERLSKYIKFPDLTKEEELECIRKWINDADISRNEKWVIETKDNHEVVGNIDVNTVNKRNNYCNVGYAIRYDYWGKGYASEALKKVSDYLLLSGYYLVECSCNERNKQSSRVMEKAGFKKDGYVANRRVNLDGTYSGIEYYSKTSVYNEICSDIEIINRYHEVEENEERDKGWAYHNFRHVKNVSDMVSKILTDLNYDEELTECSRVAAILHDTGANEGKDNHAYRSYLYAKDYLDKHNIKLKYQEEVLEAIKIHSDGFDTDNIIALVLILSDKLDVKKNRITNVGCTIEGNRQYQYIEDIDIKIENNKMIINFIVDDLFDRKEAEEFYFTLKIFKAIKSFCKKVNLDAIVLINNEEWEKFNEA